MWGAELRGVIAVAVVIVAIVVAWNRIESRDTTVATAATTTTTTTTTTTLPTTTTLSLDQAASAICDLADRFVAAVEGLPADAGPGPTARLALDFWTDVLDFASPEIRTEVVAVVNYYERYLATAEPFDFDTARIIEEGDKEGLQQLLTRPAPGLDAARGIVGFGCGLEVPDKPSMSAKAFDDLEERLLRPRRRSSPSSSS